MANGKTSRPSVTTQTTDTSRAPAAAESTDRLAEQRAAESSSGDNVDTSEIPTADAAVLQTPPTARAEEDIPTQKPRDDNRRTDGGRTVPKVTPPPSERNDGKAVLTGPLAAKVAEEQEKQARRNQGKGPKNPIPDADRGTLDRQTPALAMKALQRALDEREDTPPRKESYEATEDWVLADLADEVQLNGRHFNRGRQMVPKAMVEAFPMFVKEVKKGKEEE